MPPVKRTGAALIEILMAMMIMSIGVVMVASIFPVAVRRSIQANQLTNAALTRYQAEEMLGIFTSLVPNYTVFDATSSTELNYKEIKANVGDIRLRVVDPLGFYHLQTAGTDIHDTFGNRANAKAPASVIRTNGGLPSWALAQNTMLTKDTWQSNQESIPQSNTLTQITFSDEEYKILNDLKSNILQPPPSPNAFQTTARLEIFSKNSKESQIRTFTQADIDISTPSSPKVSFADSLPSNGKYDAVPLVRIQILDQRYSWILTTRSKLLSTGNDNIAGTADDVYSIDGDIVIFHRRPITSLPEEVYDASLVKDNNQNRVIIKWTTLDKPNVKLGNYIFDMNSGNWYQIRQIEKTDEVTKEVNILLDRKVTGNMKYVVVPESLVEVFPLRKRAS